MSRDKRKTARVAFEREYGAQILALDRSWRRPCKIVDISANGARLRLSGALDGIDLKEFFMLLSTNGPAYRRCALVRLKGDEVGVRFLDKSPAGSKRSGPQ